MRTFVQVNDSQGVAVVDRNRASLWDNKRAQNGPGIAVRKHRPEPDLSASLTTDEEH
jgi:hypothetical protein